MPDKFSEGAAYSFLDRVLSRFGAPAERMVQTMKRGLRKYSLKKGHHGDWDL
jgi:hypothetical protein